MSWEQVSGVPICSKSEDFESVFCRCLILIPQSLFLFLRNHTAFYEKVRDMTKNELQSATGCKPMCNYFKYEIMKVETDLSDQRQGRLGFQLILANNEVTTVQEVLAYDFLTLVSNFGGSLGLFIGFSFYMLWDLLMDIIHCASTKNSKINQEN